MKSLYEKLNGSYIEVGNVRIPTLVSTETNYEIVFWGQRHKAYLRENHRAIYYNLLTQGKLNSYLYKIDMNAEEQCDLLVKRLAESQAITEQLKSDNQMLWVQQMNNIANQVREIIFNDLIYTYNKAK